MALLINAILSFAFSGVEIEQNDLSQLFMIVILAVVVSMMGASLVTAVSIFAVEDIQDGERDLSFGDLISSGVTVIGPVIAVSLLAAVGVAVGIIALVIPGLLALTWWAAVVPSVVIERTGVFGAFTRSVKLVSGKAWSVFGYGLIMVVVLLVANLVLDKVVGPIVVDLIGPLAADVVLGSVTTPFVAVGYAVLYFELRRIEVGAAILDDPWTGGTPR